MNHLSISLANRLLSAGISHKVDDGSGSIGRCYASDEKLMKMQYPMV